MHLVKLTLASMSINIWDFTFSSWQVSWETPQNCAKLYTRIVLNKYDNVIKSLFSEFRLVIIWTRKNADSAASLGRDTYAY
jgi:hypothetical protein